MSPAEDQTDIGPRDQQNQYGFDGPEQLLRPQSPPGNDAPNADARAPSQSSSSKAGPAHVPFLERLRSLPEVRSIPWRPGQELPPERAVDSPRVQQRGAILLSTRGKVVDTPCEHCAAGYGRFSVCVTLEHWFQGACSSCIFTSKGNKCSLRFQTSGTADGRALRYHTDNPEVLQSYIRKAAENPKPSKKRKRRSEPAAQTLSTPVHLQTLSYSSPYGQPDQALPTSPDLDTLLQAEIARDQSPERSEYVQPAEKKQKKKPRQELVPSRANEARARGPTLTTLSQYPNDHGLIIDGQRLAGPVIVQRGWHAQYSNREQQQSLTPSTPALPERSSVAKEASGPIIDTFSKPKQRQIYAIVSGIQGGIDHLQKQLDALKTMLGIEAENVDSSDRSVVVKGSSGLLNGS